MRTLKHINKNLLHITLQKRNNFNFIKV